MKQACVLTGAFAALALGSVGMAHAEVAPSSTTVISSDESVNYGDDKVGSSFDDSYKFTTGSSGDWLVTLSASSKTLDITGATFDGTALTVYPSAPGTYSASLDAGVLASGTYTVEVTGSYSGSGVGSYDGTINFTSSAAPEPAAWSLIIAGVGLMGGALRYGRRNGWASAVA